VEPRAARILRRTIIWGIVIALVATGVLLAWGYARRHPEDLPWTQLDLARPIGMFTGRKLARLREEPGRCPALLAAAGVAHRVLEPRDDGPNCSYRDAVRLEPGGARGIAIRPEAAMSCPVVGALALWEWHVVQPAAQRHLGQRVAAIDHLGSYSCRRVNNRPEGDWSEHATANAIDVAAFRLADGRRVSVLGDWSGGGPEAAFMREVRDGACRVFATVLSPEYNEAHRDHLHFDQAAARRAGWRGLPLESRRGRRAGGRADRGVAALRTLGLRPGGRCRSPGRGSPTSDRRGLHPSALSAISRGAQDRGPGSHRIGISGDVARRHDQPSLPSRRARARLGASALISATPDAIASRLTLPKASVVLGLIRMSELATARDERMPLDVAR
jgi:hypothetical protein